MTTIIEPAHAGEAEPLTSIQRKSHIHVKS